MLVILVAQTVSENETYELKSGGSFAHPAAQTCEEVERMADIDAIVASVMRKMGCDPSAPPHWIPLPEPASYVIKI